MPQNHSWVDAKNLRRLLEEAGVVLRQPPPPVIKAALVDKQIAVGGGLPPYFTSADEPLGQTLDVFVSELAEVSGCDAVFIADDQGLLLAGAGEEALVAGTAVIERALDAAHQTLDLQVGTSLVLELADRRFAQMVWVQGPSERVVVGLIVKKALGPDFVDAIRTTLARLLAEPSEQGEQGE